MFPSQWDKEVPVALRILLPLRLQSMKAQMCLSNVVLKRWASLWRRCGEFCKIILAYILTKSNWCKSWSRLTTSGLYTAMCFFGDTLICDHHMAALCALHHGNIVDWEVVDVVGEKPMSLLVACLVSVVSSWIALSNNLKMIRIFIEQSSSAMRLISVWMASSINKICVIGQTAIHTYFIRHHFIPKKIRFCAVYGPTASLDRTSSVMIKTGMLLWMRIATVQW